MTLNQEESNNCENDVYPHGLVVNNLDIKDFRGLFCNLQNVEPMESLRRCLGALVLLLDMDLSL